MTYDEYQAGMGQIEAALKAHRGGVTLGDIHHFAWVLHDHLDAEGRIVERAKSLAWCLWDIGSRHGDEPEALPPLVAPEPSPVVETPDPVAPPATNPTVGFTEWQPENQPRRTNWLTGPPIGGDSLPGYPREMWEQRIAWLVANRYQTEFVACASYNPDIPHRNSYDGLVNPDVLRPYVEFMTARKVELWFNLGNELSEPSWFECWDNDWYFAHIADTARKLVALCDPAHPPRFVFGLEINDGTRGPTRRYKNEHGGDVSQADLWWPNGANEIAKRVKDATRCPIYLHLDTETWGPRPGDGDRPWDEHYFWGMTAFDGLCLELERVGVPWQHDPELAYYRNWAQRISGELHKHGKVLIVGETCYPGCDVASARRVADAMLSYGAAHSISG